MRNHFHSSQSGCKIKTYYKRKHFNLFRDYTNVFEPLDKVL